MTILDISNQTLALELVTHESYETPCVYTSR